MAEEEKEDEARPPGLCCGWGEDCGRGRWGEEGGREPSLSPWLLVGGVGGSWSVSSKEEAAVEPFAFDKSARNANVIGVGGWLVGIYRRAGDDTGPSPWVRLLSTPTWHPPGEKHKQQSGGGHNRRSSAVSTRACWPCVSMVKLSVGGRGLTQGEGLRETEGLTLDSRRVPLVSPKWPTGPGGSSTQILSANKSINCEFNFTVITNVTLERK